MHYLVNLVGDLFMLLTKIQYLSAVGEKIPCHKRTRVLVTLGAFAIMFFGSNFVFGQTALVVVFMLTAIMILNLMYDTKWYMKILHTGVLYIVEGSPEVIIGIILSILGIDIAFAQENIFLYTTCNFTSRLISFVIVRIIKLFVKKQYAAERKSVFLLTPLPLVTLVIGAVFLKITYIIEDTGYQIILVICYIVLIFANLLIFFFLDRMNDYTEKKEDLLLYETQYTAQKQYLNTLHAHLDETAEFRHNAKNQFLIVMGLLNSGETQKAADSIKKSLNILDTDAQDIVDSGHLIIDTLLQEKLREQKLKGIIISPQLKFKEELKVDEIEMGILLGNLIDNAIEGTERTSPEKRTPIDVKIVCMDGYVSVKVTNAVDYEVDTTNLYTIKKNKVFHGRGVKSVKNTANKYSGTTKFKCENGIFSVNVLLENRSRR